MKKSILVAFLLCTTFISGYSQIDEDKLGAWYMYFWNTTFNDSKWGLQGDLQHRNWNIAGDLEQILLRGGLTYKATDQALLTLGYGNITTGTYGDSDETFNESRIYQEALLGHKISKWVRLKHRFRYEQRWAAGTDFRTRYRYNLFLTIPLTQKLLDKGGVYLSFYNELFISGIRAEGAPVFDRNRFYGAVGYAIHDQHKVQLGIMQQSTNNWTKNQLQLSVHSSF